MEDILIRNYSNTNNVNEELINNVFKNVIVCTSNSGVVCKTYYDFTEIIEDGIYNIKYMFTSVVPSVFNIYFKTNKNIYTMNAKTKETYKYFPTNIFINLKENSILTLNIINNEFGLFVLFEYNEPC